MEEVLKGLDWSGAWASLWTGFLHRALRPPGLSGWRGVGPPRSTLGAPGLVHCAWLTGSVFLVSCLLFLVFCFLLSSCAFADIIIIKLMEAHGMLFSFMPLNSPEDLELLYHWV